MRTTKREMKRKGFTLVELLIVIVVIGVLSAMMMLSSTEAVSSARAADIVSDLRNLKTAALAWYADNLDTVEASGFNLGTSYGTGDSRKPILKYMNNDKIDEGYKFTQNNKKEWYVFYDGAYVSTASGKVNDKLAGRAATVGLYGTADSSDKFVANDIAVYMFIR